MCTSVGTSPDLVSRNVSFILADNLCMLCGNDSGIRIGDESKACLFLNIQNRAMLEKQLKKTVASFSL